MTPIIIKAHSMGEVCDIVASLICVDDDRGRALMEEEKSRTQNDLNTVYSFMNEQLSKNPATSGLRIGPNVDTL